MKSATLISIVSSIWFPVTSVLAQGLLPEDQLPFWAQEKWQALAKNEELQITTRINPFVWRGDFDGDGKSDIALLVRRTTTKKEGIVVLFQRNVRPQVLGAGKPFGNGGDDFSWVDFWSVEDRNTLQRSAYEPSVHLQSDGLIVAKEGSASALIYFKKGSPKWQQQGD